jgi:hypothetical protein
MGLPMRADVLERLSAIARGEIVAVPGGTLGTPGTERLLTSPTTGTADVVAASKSPLFQVFQLFQVEHDEFAATERAAIAVEDGRVPAAYASAWATFQISQPRNATEAEWLRAVNDGGRFLDEWAHLALDFAWQPEDVFGPSGLAWFCAGEWVKSLGPEVAITASGRIFRRRPSRDAGCLDLDSE